MAETYLATGACSGCPYHDHCHPARQRAVDPRGIGRHTSCEFYREFERRATAAEDLVHARDSARRPKWMTWLAKRL